MHDEIEMLVATLERMTVAELRARYAEVAGEPARSSSKPHLIKRIAWRVQANREGGLSERARRRAEELAEGTDLRLTPPPRKAAPVGPTVTLSVPNGSDGVPIRPGTLLRRAYKGRTIVVRVLADGGFEYEGERYGSLSAVAKRVTGSHWNGLHFFGLRPARREA